MKRTKEELEKLAKMWYAPKWSDLSVEEQKKLISVAKKLQNKGVSNE